MNKSAVSRSFFDHSLDRGRRMEKEYGYFRSVLKRSRPPVILSGAMAARVSMGLAQTLLVSHHEGTRANRLDKRSSCV